MFILMFTDGDTIGTTFAIAGGTLGILLIGGAGGVAIFFFCKQRKARKLAKNVEDVDENPVYGEYAEVYVATEVQDTCDYYSST